MTRPVAETVARSSPGTISFTISHPPSTNNLYLNYPGKGRIKSPEYNAWIEENAWLVKIACAAKRISGPYALRISLAKPDARKRDLGNLEKPISDLLVRAGAIRDDSDAQRIELEWSDRHDGVFVTVLPTTFVPVRRRAA